MRHVIMFTEKSTDVKCIAHTKNEKTMFHIKKKLTRNCTYLKTIESAV